LLSTTKDAVDAEQSPEASKRRASAATREGMLQRSRGEVGAGREAKLRPRARRLKYPSSAELDLCRECCFRGRNWWHCSMRRAKEYSMGIVWRPEARYHVSFGARPFCKGNKLGQGT
jgi:hypothetical protein